MIDSFDTPGLGNSVQSLFHGIPIGTEDERRLKDMIVVHDVFLRFKCEYRPPIDANVAAQSINSFRFSNDALRILVVLDTKCDALNQSNTDYVQLPMLLDNTVNRRANRTPQGGAAPLDLEMSMLYRNLDNTGRFKILIDDLVPADPQSSNNGVPGSTEIEGNSRVEWRKYNLTKLQLPIQYARTSTDGSRLENSNNIMFMVVNDKNISQGAIPRWAVSCHWRITFKDPQK